MKHDKAVPIADIIHRRSDANIQFNSYVTRDASVEPLFVYQSGLKRQTAPGWLSVPITYDHYIIHFITSGKGRFYADGYEYPIEAGDAFLIRPYKKNAYQADEKEPYAYYWVGFNGTEADKLVNQSGFLARQPVVRYDSNPDILSALKSINDTQKTTPSKEYLLLSYLYCIFAVLIEKNKVHYSSTYSDYCYTVSCYIRQHLGDPRLTVQQIAEHIGIDRSHLFRIFQETLHMSVKGFIHASRIQKACELLKHSNDRVGDIANSCGFSDTAHFINQFKKMMGCTPLVYRKECTADSIQHELSIAGKAAIKR